MADQIKLKIYGERNTGTNYIETLAARNLEVTLLPGRVPARDLPTKLTRQLKKVLPGADDWHEATRDSYFRRTFDRNLGWKHMCPAPERIGPQTLAAVRFVMVVKNPYSWLLSLFRKPYHVGGRDTEFADFLERRLPVMEERENIGPEALDPVEVWNRKGRGYLALQAAADRSVLLAYEDFLRDEMKALERIATELDLPKRSEFVSVSSGVKRSDRNTSRSDYVDYYLNERWRDHLTEQTIATINARLDPEILAAFGYEKIAQAAE